MAPGVLAGNQNSARHLSLKPPYEHPIFEVAVVSGCRGGFQKDPQSSVQMGDGIKPKQRRLSRAKSRPRWDAEVQKQGKLVWGRRKEPHLHPRHKQGQGTGPKDESWWEMDAFAA